MTTSPHVLLICTDHWPGPLLGAAGHERILTPTLDQLVANGILFTQAYTATPSCILARRSLMTGTTARTHGDRVFDVLEDPQEMCDLSGDPDMADVRAQMLVDELYGSDQKWLRDGEPVGEADRQLEPLVDRGLSGQRGWR